MNISLEKVTDFLKPFLLQDIIIRTDKKVLKRGKLKIFQVKQYYINLTLEFNNSIKSYEIPYPFKMHHDNEKGVLNYHLMSYAISNDGDTSDGDLTGGTVVADGQATAVDDTVVKQTALTIQNSTVLASRVLAFFVENVTNTDDININAQVLYHIN